MQNYRKLLIALVIGLFAVAAANASDEPTRASAPDDHVETRSQVEQPSPLLAIVQNAQGIVLLASRNQWPEVRRDVQSLNRTWAGFKPLDPASAEPDSMRRMEAAQAELNSLSIRRDQTGTILAAFEVGDSAMDLYQLFNPTIPAAIQRLEDHESRVLRDVALGRPERANEVLAGAASSWHYFQPAVIDHGGENIALRYQASLDLQRDYLDTHRYGKLEQEIEASFGTLFEAGLLFD